ncbi:MAG TPA: type 1 glutamine amidotransferase [Allosphingosinicella sp.]|jgi:GMP synthase-like glutamine amidotransferase
MKVGILETGRPPGDLAARFGDYPAMFARLLGPGFETATYDVAAGASPPSADAHRAYIVTGSPAGVYDALPWIEPLKSFLCTAKGKAKLVGICFGHQIMAEAFGGRVEKSDKGWGVGLHTYELTGRAPWMDEAPRIAVPVSHQDQIVAQPPRTSILARSDFTRFGLLAYADQPAISMQFHPEFEPDFAKALIELRRTSLPDPDATLDSLDAPDDRARVARWIRRFLADGPP